MYSSRMSTAHTSSRHAVLSAAISLGTDLPGAATSAGALPPEQ